MGSIGVPELIFILVVALVVFGPRKLPEIGKSLGKALAEFQRARNELISTVEEEVRKSASEPSTTLLTDTVSIPNSYPHNMSGQTDNETKETPTEKGV
jgi:TatA/E family protein of Tat protein translocase